MKKIVLGIGGASGSIYARLLLERLVELSGQFDECGIVMSTNALTNWQLEQPGKDIHDFGYRIYDQHDFTAPFASGSAKYNIMIVCPCSMGSLGRIAHGLSDDLLTRAADVMLKERRTLILVPRETPLSLIHLENMTRVTRAGAIVCPAIPSYYSKPASVDEVAMTVVNRVLDLAGFDLKTYRWGSEM